VGKTDFLTDVQILPFQLPTCSVFRRQPFVPWTRSTAWICKRSMRSAGSGAPRAYAPLERPEPWTLYGRLGLLNFQNQLATDSSGTQLSLRRTGPGLGGRIYIGIRRRF